MLEFEEELAEIIGTFRLEALAEYKYAVAREGLTLTGELLDSFESTLRTEASRFAYECVISFQDYGRFKDMKRLNTGDKLAPLEAFEYFVEKVGVQNFLKNIWADRYGNIKSQTRLIRDIAWGVRIARFRQIEHIRKGRGWYSNTTGKLYGITSERVRQAAALAAIRSVRQTLNPDQND